MTDRVVFMLIGASKRIREYLAEILISIGGELVAGANASANEMETHYWSRNRLAKIGSGEILAESLGVLDVAPTFEKRAGGAEFHVVDDYRSTRTLSEWKTALLSGRMTPYWIVCFDNTGLRTEDSEEALSWMRHITAAERSTRASRRLIVSENDLVLSPKSVVEALLRNASVPRDANLIERVVSNKPFKPSAGVGRGGPFLDRAKALFGAMQRIAEKSTSSDRALIEEITQFVQTAKVPKQVLPVFVKPSEVVQTSINSVDHIAAFMSMRKLNIANLRKVWDDCSSEITPEVASRLSVLLTIADSGLLSRVWNVEDLRSQIVVNKTFSLKTILGSSFNVILDHDWYLSAHPDVAAANQSPFLHFAQWGMEEGRDPSALFSTSYYIGQAEGPNTTKVSPLLHYILVGDKAGLNPHPLFSTDYYNSQKPNLEHDSQTGLEHYLSVGWRENKNPNPWFDTAWYREKYESSGLAHKNPLVDFIVSGAQLGRSPGPKFDSKWYLDEYTDVREEGTNPLIHYLLYGRHEERSPGPISIFDGLWVEKATAEKPRIPSSVQTRLDSTPTGDLLDYRSSAALRNGILGRRPKVNWVIQADNHGWAYGNNARRLIRQLMNFDHIFDGAPIDDGVNIYFDIRIFQKANVEAKAAVLRIGGPRPLQLSFGNDTNRLKAGLEGFDEIIALNNELGEKVADLHPSVSVIPNGVDSEMLSFGRPKVRRRFTAGFAGNISTSREREIKGYDLASAACAEIGIELKVATKGKDQIPSDEMRERFFDEIDCLIHPVGPGKEGSSNVIMEALALGVPVITTRHAGYHAEMMTHGKNILFCERSKASIVQQLLVLKSDPNRRESLGLAGRQFVSDHQCIDAIAARYDQIISRVSARNFGTSVCFVPFWENAAEFASGRLRCIQPTKILNRGLIGNAEMGYNPECVVVIVSQLASDETLKKLKKNKKRQFIIYDICDRYHADKRIVGGVKAADRFKEIVEIADLVVCSTSSLKQELAALNLGCPVSFIPDGIDYFDQTDSQLTDVSGPALWFGNPGRGNFESARWALDVIRKDIGLDIKIISRRRAFVKDADYRDHCEEWSSDAAVTQLKQGSFALISHASDESLKSANRLITAVSNGIPVIASNSPSCAELLNEGGYNNMIVSTKAQLVSAVRKLKNTEYRIKYINTMQSLVDKKFGTEATRFRYEKLLTGFSYRKSHARKLRVLYVSHNLQHGEGAPTSLMQTVLGLRDAYGFKPTVYCPIAGSLKENYIAEGVEIIAPEPHKKEKTLVNRVQREYNVEREKFTNILRRGNYDLVMCNTAKTLCYAGMANTIGVPAICVIRESSADHVDLSFCSGEMLEDSQWAISQAAGIVFVSDFTRMLWAKHHKLAPNTLIANGIDTSIWRSLREESVRDVRERIGLPKGSVIILSVGTITKRKGQSDILEAFLSLSEKARKKAHIVLVGARPGSYLEAMLSRLRTLDPSVRNRIHIVPETTDVGSWYRASDIFVLSSYNESYPRVVIEAMFFGLPCVVTDVFGTKEQVVPNVSGLFYTPGDIETLTGHLESLIKRKAARSNFGRSAEKRFWELTTYEEMVHQYACILQNVAQSKPRKAEML